MMNFWSKKFLNNKFARCIVISSTLPIATTPTISLQQ